MENRDRPHRRSFKRKETKVTDVSDKPELRERIRNRRQKLSVTSIAILLAVLMSVANAYGQDSQREISAKLEDDNAVLESTSLSGNDVLLFEINTFDASLLLSHKIPETRDFEITLKLISIVEFEEEGDDDQHEIVNVVQIARSPFSAKVYDLVLADIDGKGVEVSWDLGYGSSLTLNLELFFEEVSYRSVEYGPTSARMLFNLSDYTFEVKKSKISLEAEVLSPYANLTWKDMERFHEIFAGTPSINITFGFPEEILVEGEAEEASYSSRKITGGLVFSADYGDGGDVSWVGFCRADIIALEEAATWHPIGDLSIFGGTLLVSATVVVFLKLGFLRLWGKLGGGLAK